MAYFIGTFSNGYCGCEEIVPIIADTIEQAEKYMEDRIDIYGYEYEYVTEFEEEEDDEAYWEGVTYEVREATQEEIEDEYDADGWVKII